MKISPKRRQPSNLPSCYPRIGNRNRALWSCCRSSIKASSLESKSWLSCNSNRSWILNSTIPSQLIQTLILSIVICVLFLDPCHCPIIACPCLLHIRSKRKGAKGIPQSFILCQVLIFQSGFFYISTIQFGHHTTFFTQDNDKVLPRI